MKLTYIVWSARAAHRMGTATLVIRCGEGWQDHPSTGERALALAKSLWPEMEVHKVELSRAEEE